MLKLYLLPVLLLIALIVPHLGNKKPIENQEILFHSGPFHVVSEPPPER